MHRLFRLGGVVFFAWCSPLVATPVLFPGVSGLGPRAIVDISRAVGSGRNLQEIKPVELQLHLGGVDLKRNGAGVHQVKVQGMVPMGILGAPDLPTTGVLLAVPEGSEPVLKILSTERRTVEQAPVAPCQPLARCSLPKALRAFHFDKQLYESRGLFPKRVAALEEVGVMQGVRLVRVALNPVQAELSNGSLHVTTAMRVRVEFQGNPKPIRLAKPVHELLGRTAVNGTDSYFVVSARQPETLVVVCADSLWSSIQPLLEWKVQRGLRVHAVTYSQAGGSRDAVKRYIQNLYNTTGPKPSYLLLVGNHQTLPGFRESTSMGGAATDYPYTLLEGNDAIPDVFHGRLLANTQSEAVTQVRRWINHEKYAGSDPYFSQATTIASDEGFGPSDEDYANAIKGSLTTHQFTQVDSFFQANRTASHQNIWDALAEGRSWLSYFGHGSGTGWDSTNRPFNVSDVRQVDNAGRLPFIIDVACQNASWVDISECFGKTWMTLEKGAEPVGALAYYGGSVNISWHEPATMSVGIARYHFEKPAYSIGATVLAGQIYLMEQMGIRPNTVENMKWFNLFGDPSLELRTAPPRQYLVSAQPTLMGGLRYLEVRAEDGFGGGIDSVRVSLTQPGTLEPLAVAETDPHGAARLPLPPSGSAKPGTKVTTTGYNLATYEIELL